MTLKRFQIFSRGWRILAVWPWTTYLWSSCCGFREENWLNALAVSNSRVGIQVRLKWCAIDYYLILRHVQTTQIGQNLLTNLQQPRRIYARNCNYDRPESQPRPRPKLPLMSRRKRALGKLDANRHCGPVSIRSSKPFSQQSKVT